MLKFYFSKQKAIRLFISFALIAFGIFVGIFVVLTCIDISAEENSLPIYRVKTDDNKIALTFDVAWGNEDTQQIIDILNEFDVKATFFITGEWAQKFPEDVKAYFDSGHEIANHSYSHPYPTQVSMNDLINDTRKCANILKEITGMEPKLYRAPYGDWNSTVVSTINGMGYDFIEWDCDSLDWKDLSAEEICGRILPKVKSGSILLFHTDKENTHEALPMIIKSLKADNFEFIRVGELVYKDNYAVDANGEQYLLSE